VRIDIEKIEELSKSDEDLIFQYIQNSIDDDVDVIVISDYGKGFCSYNICSQTISLAKKKRIPVIVDPKGDNWTKYTDAMLITPNINELAIISGKETLQNEDSVIEKYGREVLLQYNISNLIVTRSEKGISIITANTVEHIHAEARDVYDVSGAGDTVVATLAVSIAKGLPLHDCVKLANIAAGIVVGKKGTTPIRFDELKYSLQNKTEHKILNPEEMTEKLKTIKDNTQTIVFTNGCFDILHRGHITCLSRAKEMGDILIVGINSDASVKRLKGNERPFNIEHDRIELIASLQCVDYVILFDEDTPLELIKMIKPDILAKGGDYKPDEIIGKEYAGEIKIIPFVEGYSSSKIISKL
jgi:D-beta-D-heptose 7-phosphate kinase/D-beta-D-heptose 1-phosphate adenosyltransferase